ncbi:hypothetical protein V4F39_20865 [Aquincola sp. MAHUQ-54]|uniref:Uncharacterized protein n=1 Tax=Aquincola agrisoli TaxID=3119538 RepID=A0AAW9QGL6_9BURK
MSDNDFFAPPLFKPAEALVQLKRQLRDLKLSEQGSRYTEAGLAVVELGGGDTAIEVRLVKRPARTPEWTVHRLASSADVRRFVDHLKIQLARWRQDE